MKMTNNKSGKTILLVEDEAIIAMSDSMKLRDYGYNVVHAQTGQKAIDVVNDVNNHIDLILLDINLNEKLDGTEIAKTILRKHDIPIIFHSSHTERDIVQKTENITSYGYVVKDGITVLDASIKMAFRLHEANKNLKDQKLEIESKSKDLSFYEKRYRRLFESARDGILILNAADGMIEDVNPFLINLLGYSKDEFLNKNIWDISAFKSIDYAKQLFKELQDKEYIRYDDLPLETSDGRKIHVEFVSNVYLVDSQKVIQCNIRDITNRVIYEKTLTDNIKEKKALLREIQHRTKNSFSMITSLMNLRSRVTNSEEARITLDDLRLRVKSISDLYTLLHETDSFFEAQLKTYCDKVIKSMFSLTTNITIIKSLEEITVSTKNAATIGMILVELLSNAIKYAFPNAQKGTIEIQLKLENSQIIMLIEDNGIGLNKDFDIESSSGLGLQLVNAMINQLNGAIKFTSDNGTKVSMSIPIR